VTTAATAPTPGTTTATQQPPAEATPPTTPSLSNEELNTLLVEDDAPATETPQATETETAEKPAAAEAEATETTADEGAKPEGETPAAAAEATETTSAQQQPQPGTPDKALQKVQQDLATALRAITDLSAKVDAGGTLTAGEQQQLQRQASKVDELKQRVQGKQFDPIDDGERIAASVLEQDEQITALKQQVQQLGTQLQQQQATNAWSQLEKQYAGVNVQDVWNKAKDDAKGYAQYGAAAYQARADELFHERAAAASKSVAARTATTATTTPAPTKQPAKPAKLTPPTTKNGAAVTVQPTAPRASEQPVDFEAKAEKAYAALVVDDT
jgi:hypothetical protein